MDNDSYADVLIALTKNEISALSNAVWIGVLVAVFVGLIVGLYVNAKTHNEHFAPETRQAVYWAMLSLFCGILHRSYWQTVILFKDGGRYDIHGWTEVREWLPLLSVGVVIGTVGAARQIVAPQYRKRVLALLCGWLVVIGAVSVWLA